MTSPGRPQFEPDDEAIYYVSVLEPWVREHPEDEAAKIELGKWRWVVKLNEAAKGA